MESEPCKCYETINGKLAEHNTRITLAFILDSPYKGSPWPIATSQIESGRGKKKAVGLYASYCPMCGDSLRKEAPNEQ